MTLLTIARCAVLATALVFPIHFAKSTTHETISEYTNHTLKDLYCLTKNIYHEARGESYLGKIAVAQVTLNRVNHETKWPSTICAVVYQKIKGTPQFSWTTMPNLPVRDSKAWEEAKQVAYGVITGDLLIKNFNHTHFHNTTVEFAQRKKNSKTIGNHVFYN